MTDPAAICIACRAPLNRSPLPDTVEKCLRCGLPIPAGKNLAEDSSDSLTLPPLPLDATPQAQKPAEASRNPFSKEFLSQYELVRLLGSGAAGSVYLMKQSRLDRLVAVKVLKQSLTDGENRRFVQEARVIAKLNHASIRAIYDVGVDAAMPYMVCEYVDGPTLSQMLKEKGPPPLEHALRMACTILDGLELAHRQHVIHRDLKPANILVANSKHPKIADFGLARAGASGADTITGSLAGTPKYMAPEQCEGLPVTPATDLYSMGILIFEMLTGRVPFTVQRGDPISWMEAHLTARPATVSSARADLPPALDAVLERALAKAPGERFRSAAAFAEPLLEVLTSQFGRTGSLVLKRLDSSGAAPTGWGGAIAGMLIGDRYELARPLSESDSGNTWLARDQELDGNEVAVKLLSASVQRDPAALTRLVQAARAALGLSHPNIVRLINLERGDSPFLVLEHVAGPTLEAELARRNDAGEPAYTPADALPILEDLANGLDHAHSRQVVHGDLKPAHVVLETHQGKVVAAKISEFGIAAVIRSNRQRPDEPASHAGAAYMSPEIICGDPGDARSDVFSLSAVLYKMLTLLPPLAVNPDISWPGRPGLMPSASLLPPAVASLLTRGLSPQPADRPQSARELLALYRQALAEPRPDAASPPRDSSTPNARLRMTGAFRVLSADPVAEPELVDRYRTGDRLTSAGIFQIVCDEAHKDGVVEPWESKLLAQLALLLELPTATVDDITLLSRRKHEKGRLGSKRRLDPKVAYCKALYIVHHADGMPAALAQLAALRTLFGFSDDDHRALVEFVKSKA